MSVRKRINGKHGSYSGREKRRNPLPLPLRVCLSLYSRLVPADYLPSPPPMGSSLTPAQPILCLLFSSSPIILLFHFSLAQLIGHVCTMTWGPDIIAGQIARRLASDLSQLSCTQTPADWKAQLPLQSRNLLIGKYSQQKNMCMPLCTRLSAAGISSLELRAFETE